MTTTSPYVRCGGATTLGPPCKNHKDTCPHTAAHQRLAAARARAAGAATVRPGTAVPALAPAQPAAPGLYEIPTALEGWRDTHAELTSQMVAAAGGTPVTLATPYGILSVRIARMNMAPTTAPAEYHLWVSGTVAVGGRAYKVWGPAGGLLISPTDGLSNYDDEEIEHIRGHVEASLVRPKGEHVELYALADAEKCVGWVGRATRNFTVTPAGNGLGVNQHVRNAQVALLKMWAVDLPEPARQIAYSWAEADFAGSGADLRDAASEVADLRGGASTVALSMIEAGYTGPPEDLAPIAEATVLHPVYHGAP